MIPASRLGYRITYEFVRTYFGRIFDNPTRVLDEAMLRPETQDMDAFADGILNITEAQQRVALQYFEDGSIEQACPPLRALLSIMAHGQFEGKDVHHPDIRRLFTREHLLASDWYLPASAQRPAARHPALAALPGLSHRLRPPRPTTASPGQLDIPPAWPTPRASCSEPPPPRIAMPSEGTIGADAI